MKRIRVLTQGIRPALPRARITFPANRRLRFARITARGLQRIALAALCIATSIGCIQTISPYGAKTRQARNGGIPPAASTPEHELDLPDGAVDRLTVNGEVIRAVEILAAEQSDLRDRARQMPSAEYRRYLEQRAATGIMRKIADILLYREASKRLSDEEQQYLDKIVDGEIRKIVTTDFAGSQRRFEKHLEGQGRTIDDVHREMKHQLVVMRHLERNLKPKAVQPTRAELLALFEADVDQWRRPPRRRMLLVDVRIGDQPPPGVDRPSAAERAAAKTEARRRIEAAASEVRNGASFEDVAREYSNGLHADDGGAWGWVTVEGVRDRFRPAVEALYELEAGAVSGIIEADDAFFLVRCDEIDPGLEPTFADVQIELREQHLRAEYIRLERELVEKLQAEATITPPDLDGFLRAVLATAPRPGDD